MEKPILHVVSLSGGKDSTAMLLRMIEEGMPVDIILFCDTGLEFEGMYNHIDRLEKYIGKPITRLKSPHDFEYLFLEHMPKRNNPELVGRKGYSWGGPRNRWCTSMLKIRIINKYLRELSKQYTLVQYVGIAADEPHRVRDLRYPLIEWGMTEKDCLEYCKARGFDWDASKMTEEKLPKSFVSVYYYRQWSFMQAKGVVDVRYCPAYWSGNHMYKDDYLLISYKEKITCRMPETRRIPIDEYQGYDIILFGRSIIDFLDGVEKYSHLDVSAIRKEMRRKRIWYVRKNPSHQELSNDEIDFETKVYFLAREFESSDFSLELQKEEFLKYQKHI